MQRVARAATQRRPRAALLAAAVLAPMAAGQELRWQLPRRGAAEYARETTAGSDVAESASAARALQPTAPVPERYLSRLEPAPVLCEGELDDDRRRVVDPPRGLRDVIRAVALDLSVRGSSAWRFGRLVPFGDLDVRGRVRDCADAGWDEELRLDVDTRPVAPQPGESRALRDEQLEGLFPAAAAGELVVRRSLDRERGLVRAFDAVLELVVREDRRAFRKIVVRDAWTLVAVRDNQDAHFRGRVAESVRDGARWVRATLADGAAAFLRDDDGKSFGSGRIALGALTLLHADYPRDDPVVEQAFAALRRRKLVDTYALSTALLAMSQRYAVAGERELLRRGGLRERPRRQLDDRDRGVAGRWLQRLLANLDDGVDAREVARWTYTGGSWADNSLTQYALLGLDAADLCGLDVPGHVWPAAAAHFAATQAPAYGRDVALRLTTYADLAAALGDEFEPRARRTAARGFAYKHAGEAPYGGMTAAATAGLVLARAGCHRAGTASRARLAAIDRAIDEGFAWLAAEFSARRNPGACNRADRHWYYWLYSLERACELAAVARVQGRDWYYEGALQLMAMQQPSGAFRADPVGTPQLDATCFAVLFLKKATMAAITGR